MPPTSPLPADPDAEPRSEPTLPQIAAAFVRAGLSAFGGGVSVWMMQEVVKKHHWVDEREFLAGLGVSQALPGVNVVNLSIWLGYRLHGPSGAVTAALATLLPTTAVAIVVVALFSKILGYEPIHVAVGGAGSAAIGLSLMMSVRAIRNIGADIPSLLILAATVVVIFVFRMPLVIVLLVGAPLSIAYAYWRLRKGSL